MAGQFYYKRGPKAPLGGPAAWPQLETLHQDGQIDGSSLVCEENGELWYPYDAAAQAIQRMATPPPNKKKTSSLGHTVLTILLYLLSACCLFLLTAIILDCATNALGGLLVAFVIASIAAGLIVLTLIERRLDIIDKKLSPYPPPHTPPTVQQLFYCQKDDGRAEGPYTWPEIQQLRTKQIIQDETPIRQEHCDTWVPYHRIVIFVKPSLKRSLEFPDNPAFLLLCLIAVAWLLFGLWSLCNSSETDPRPSSTWGSVLAFFSAAAGCYCLGAILKWFVACIKSSSIHSAQPVYIPFHLLSASWIMFGIWMPFVQTESSVHTIAICLAVLILLSTAAFFYWMASILKWLALFTESSCAGSSRTAYIICRLITATWAMAGIWTLFARSGSSPQSLSTCLTVLTYLSIAAFFYWTASILQCLITCAGRRAA